MSVSKIVEERNFAAACVSDNNISWKYFFHRNCDDFSKNLETFYIWYIRRTFWSFNAKEAFIISKGFSKRIGGSQMVFFLHVWQRFFPSSSLMTFKTIASAIQFCQIAIIFYPRVFATVGTKQLFPWYSSISWGKVFTYHKYMFSHYKSRGFLCWYANSLNITFSLPVLFQLLACMIHNLRCLWTSFLFFFKLWLIVLHQWNRNF